MESLMSQLSELQAEVRSLREYAGRLEHQLLAVEVSVSCWETDLKTWVRDLVDEREVRE